MLRQSSYESCTSTITETPTIQSEPPVTTTLLLLPKNSVHMDSSKRPQRSRQKHKARPIIPSIQTQRSSRLFFLLLHLVGVSTKIKRKGWPGITAVHPAKTIYLQRLNVESSRSLIELVNAFDEDLLQDPFWFQDGDGRCLGIGGFGECGDTLWRVRRREGRRKRQRSSNGKSRKRQISQYDEESRENTVCVWPFFCERDSAIVQSRGYDDGFDEIREEDGLALELVDMADFMYGSHVDKQRRRRRRVLWLDDGKDQHEAECLVALPPEGSSSSLQLGSCTSEQAWMWHVNRDGVLVRELAKNEKRKLNRRKWIGPAITAGSRPGLQHSNSDVGFDIMCLHKFNSTGASMLPCHGEKRALTDHHSALVSFSLVRYPSASNRLTLNSSNEPEWTPWITLEGSLSKQSDNQSLVTTLSELSASDHHMPSSRVHASNAKQRHLEVKSNRNMLHTGLDQGSARKHISARTSASHIRDAPSTTVDGLPFHAQHSNDVKAQDGDKNTPGKIKTALLHKEKPQKRQKHSNDNETRETGSSEPSTHHRPIKIPVHPYIEASKDGIWVDPLTSLEYPTDLCKYLGHTKQEAGRHTLMGVGQYFRTAFNIKVYGAALYVAKRDVLADPKFARYAALSSDELRNRDDFYEHLMNMPAPGEDPTNSPGGFFDRTLMVKTNMQLSTDAMRKSLEADWSLLTDEMKTLIIDSSFRERSADERMLAKIKSKENSSNCSCGQKAPEEYAAEPSCCARGTELLFTWRKNGDFEVRLDGRVMDTFPRPDMARGIFSEYMNNDPISLDAKAHFADGFPFLLAPLAQVKGMSSVVPIPPDSPKKTDSNPGNPLFRLMMHPVNNMNSQAHTLSKWMQEGAAEVSSTLDDALGSAVGIARGVSAEFERRRMELLDNAFALHDEINSLITSSLERDEGIAGREGKALVASKNGSSPSVAPSRGPLFDQDVYASSDEIGVELKPTMNLSHWLFFATVHVYLVLLFVVSIQDSSYTTKFIVKRTKVFSKR